MTPFAALARKLDLVARGARLPPPGDGVPPWFAPGVAVDLRLDQGPLVRVGLGEAGYRLEPLGARRFALADGEWRAEAELQTLRGPAALGKVRGRFAVIPVRAGFPSPAQVVAELRAVFGAARADFVRFDWRERPGSAAALLALVAEVRNHFDTFLQVVAGPVSPEAVVDLYGGGVDALGLEVGPEEPGLAEALDRAGAVFPAGTVSWHLPWRGAWPKEAEELVRRAAAARVIPVVDLAPAVGRVPAPGEAERLAAALAAVHVAMRSAALPLYWLQEEGDEVGPLEAAALAGEGLGWAGVVRDWADTRVGSAAARGLAHLRRQLRVRRVRQSFESAGL